jgi:hypothetical protein
MDTRRDILQRRGRRSAGAANGIAGRAVVARHPARPRDWSDDELGSLGRVFGVSNEVILRRLLTAGRTSQAFYNQRHALYGSFFDAPAPAESETEFKRNMPQEVVSDIGRPRRSSILATMSHLRLRQGDVDGLEILCLPQHDLSLLRQLQAGNEAAGPAGAPAQFLPGFTAGRRQGIRYRGIR